MSNSCARVDAIFVKQAGSRSHITVQRVMNTHGPQTAVASQWSRIRLSEDNDDNTSLFSIDERIANAEKHLSLQAGEIELFCIVNEGNICNKGRLLFIGTC